MKHAPLTVYLVAADPAQRARLEAALAPLGSVVAFGSAPSFLACADFTDYACTVVTLDPGGMDVLQFVHAAPPSLPLIVLGGDGDIGLAVDLIRAGAADYVDQPQDPRRLRAAVMHATRALRPEEG